VYLRPVKLKGYLFLFLLCSSQAAGAQSFSLFYHGVKLGADTELVRTGTTDTLEMTTWLTIRNDAGTEKQIQAKKTETTMAPGAACSICWAGYCYPTQTYQSEYPMVLEPGQDSTSCFAHFLTDGTPGTSIVRWTYYNALDPSDSVSVVIQYITYPTAIPSPEGDDKELVQVSPNPADMQVVFRFQDPACPVYSITLRTLTGQTILHATTGNPGGSIKLDTSVLPAGIYTYTLVSGGNRFTTGQLLIRH
jgi:hypothetical protein